MRKIVALDPALLPYLSTLTPVHHRNLSNPSATKKLLCAAIPSFHRHMHPPPPTPRSSFPPSPSPSPALQVGQNAHLEIPRSPPPPKLRNAGPEQPRRAQVRQHPGSFSFQVVMYLLEAVDELLELERRLTGM